MIVADEQTLNGIRIGVIREHMDKKLFNEADVETIDLTVPWRSASHRATMVDPGPGGALLQGCIDKYLPFYRNRVFIEQYPKLPHRVFAVFGRSRNSEMPNQD
jgi:amidase